MHCPLESVLFCFFLKKILYHPSTSAKTWWRHTSASRNFKIRIENFKTEQCVQGFTIQQTNREMTRTIEKIAAVNFFWKLDHFWADLPWSWSQWKTFETFCENLQPWRDNAKRISGAGWLTNPHQSQPKTISKHCDFCVVEKWQKTFARRALSSWKQKD